MVDVPVVLQSLHRLHDGLVGAVTSFGSAGLGARSYCSEWSVAQVASHLGSGAQITAAVVDAGLAGESGPDIAAMRRVWAVWDAKGPGEQAGDALTADRNFLAVIDGISDTERRSWRTVVDGAERDLPQVLSERLVEVTVHLWDMTVPANPAAGLDADAAAIIIDTLGDVVAHGGAPTADAFDVRVDTTDPIRAYHLTVDAGGAALAPAPAGEPATMHAAHVALPAEAFIRLVYGRLDANHTPQIELVGIGIDRLRQAFPGF